MDQCSIKSHIYGANMNKFLLQCHLSYQINRDHDFGLIFYLFQ